MDDNTIQEIRQDIRDLRNDIYQWRQELSGVGERVAKIEATVKPAIVDNGTPSRLSEAEDRINSLEQQWWKLTGASIVLWGLVLVAYEYIKATFWGH